MSESLEIVASVEPTPWLAFEKTYSALPVDIKNRVHSFILNTLTATETFLCSHSEFDCDVGVLEGIRKREKLLSRILKTVQLASVFEPLTRGENSASSSGQSLGIPKLEQVEPVHWKTIFISAILCKLHVWNGISGLIIARTNVVRLGQSFSCLLITVTLTIIRTTLCHVHGRTLSLH